MRVRVDHLRPELLSPRVVSSVAVGRASESLLRRFPRRRAASAYVLSGWSRWRYPEFLEHALQSAGAAREYLAGDGPRLLRRTGITNFAKARPVQSNVGFTEPGFDFIALRERRSLRVVTEISEDYFSQLPSTEALHRCEPGGAAMLPYFAHPAMLRRIDRRVVVNGSDARPIRIGFAGRSSQAYEQIATFDLLSRPAIVSLVRDQFDQHVDYLDGASARATDRPIVLSISGPADFKTGRGTNYQLLGDDYLDFLASTDFALSPPGIFMPHSHNVVEAMSQGAIPMLNYNSWLAPRLEDGVNCLQFETEEELSQAVQTALAMPLTRIREMRAEVLAHYNSFLCPASVGRQLLQRQPSTLFVNAETHSLGWWTERPAGPDRSPVG